MKIVNKLNLDSPPIQSEHGSWRYARNVQISERGDYTENEDGLTQVYSIPNTYQYLGKIVASDRAIIFYFDIDKKQLVIKSSYDNEWNIIIKDARYENCKVIGNHTYNYKGELIIVFGCRSLDNTKPELLIINTSTPYDRPIELNTKEYEYILLYPNYFKSIPSIDVDTIAGNLNTGTYFAAVQYEDENNNTSEFTEISRPIVINSKYEKIIDKTQENLILFRAWTARGTVAFGLLPKWFPNVFEGNIVITITVEDVSKTIDLGLRLGINGNDDELTVAAFGTFNTVKKAINEKINAGLGTVVKDTRFKFTHLPLLDADDRIGDSLFKVETQGSTKPYTITINYTRQFEYPPDLGQYEMDKLTNKASASGTFIRNHIVNLYQVTNYSGMNTQTPVDFDNLNTAQQFQNYESVISGTPLTRSIQPFNTRVIYPKVLPSGKPSGRGIKFKLTNLNTNYNKIRIAILYYEDRTLKSVGVTNSLDYTGNDLIWDFTTTSQLATSALESIVINNIKYTKSMTIANNMNKLILANLRSEGNYFDRFQSISNNIKLSYNVTKKFDYKTVDVPDSDKVISYSDTTSLYNYQQFKFDEVYCFYIAYHYIKGGILCVNHIPNKLNADSRALRQHISNNKYPTQLIEIGGQPMMFHQMPEFDKVHNFTSTGTLGQTEDLSILGIDVSNVIIPADLKGICSGWSIYYAERNNANITRIGQVFIPVTLENDLAAFRQPIGFDLYYNKYPSANIKALKQVLHCRQKPPSSSSNDLDKLWDYVNKSVYVRSRLNQQYIPISKIEYISGIDSPTGSNDYIQIYDMSGKPYVVEGTITELGQGLYDVITNNDNIYADIFNQTLVYTGKTISSDYNKVVGIYGGDTVWTRNAHRLSVNDGADSTELDKIKWSSIIYYFSESVYNLELRHEGSEAFQKIYPQSTQGVVNTAPIRKGSYINDEFGNSYDITYSKLSSIKNPLVDRKQFEEYFKNRIAVSDVNSSESTVLGWRNFKSDNYIDVGLNRGEIIKVTTSGQKLYIQNRFGLFLAQIKDVLQLADGSQAWLGTGDLFDRPPTEIMDDDSGGIGCRDYDSVINTQFGYVVADRDRNSIYVLGETLNEILASGVKGWFKANALPNIDDKITIGFDYPRKRLLIKYGNHILSYNLIVGGFVCFHDYHFKDIANIRSGETLVLNDASLRRFNSTIVTTYPSIIDVNIVYEPNISKLFQSIIWSTEYGKSEAQRWDKTIDYIMVYNDTQCTGLLPVNANKMWYDTQTGVHKSDQWYFNELFDAVINDKEPFLLNFEPNSNINIDAKNWYEQSQIISKFITIRLRSDNSDGQKLKFLNLSVNLIKDAR